MMYLKSILVGIVGAVAASMLWILTVFVVPLLIQFSMSRDTGSGGIGAVSVGVLDSGLVLAAALVGFAIGFFWEHRRLSKSRLRDR
jgi:type II secretory pathway component PulF